MTKIELVEHVYKTAELASKKDAVELVETIIGMMKQTLSSGEDIKLSGFGSFQVRKKKQRVGRNPQTGDEMEIPERRVVTFKPSQVLKDAVNQN